MGPGNKYFVTMDQTSGYFQVPISEETKAATAFVTSNRGCFTFNVLPMGLQNSSNDFIRITSQLMEEAGCYNYCKHFDYVLLYAKDTLEEMCLA